MAGTEYYTTAYYNPGSYAQMVMGTSSTTATSAIAGDIQYYQWTPAIYDVTEVGQPYRTYVREWVPQGIPPTISPEELQMARREVARMAQMDGLPSTWQVWMDGTAGAATTNVWGDWVSGAWGTPYATPREPTEAERQAAEEYQRQAQAREEQRVAEAQRQEAERLEAQARAEELLRENLEPEQLKEYLEHGCITVTIASGVRYRIKQGWTGNIEELGDNGKARAKLCVHLADQGCPNQDNMLAQLLFLRTEPDLLLKTANRTVVGS